MPSGAQRHRRLHANNEHLLATSPQVPQGISADLIATIEGFTRERVRRARRSRARTGPQVAIAEGRFDRSLVPILNDDGTVALDHEEFPRPGTTAEGLAELARAFRRWATSRTRADAS